MKLNYDCLRTTLLAIEKFNYIVEDKQGNLTEELLWFDNLVKLVNEGKTQYSRVDIYYCVSNLEQAGFIDVHFDFADDALNLLCIERITYCGHEFIEHIKSDNVWNKAKGVFTKIGSCSVDIISQVTTQVIASLITQNMQ